MVKVIVVFYSMYGHMFQMVKAFEEGCKSVEGVECVVARVKETLPDEVLEKMGALEAKKQFADIPVANPKDLEHYDGIVFGVPTRFSMAAAQIQTFIDQTGGDWFAGKLNARIGSVMVSAAVQHAGQEMTFIPLHNFMLHHGMIVVGNSNPTADAMKVDEVNGCGPYGASTITAPDGSRMPSERELGVAKAQGARVAHITKKMWAAGRHPDHPL